MMPELQALIEKQAAHLKALREKLEVANRNLAIIQQERNQLSGDVILAAGKLEGLTEALALQPTKEGTA